MTRDSGHMMRLDLRDQALPRPDRCSRSARPPASPRPPRRPCRSRPCTYSRPAVCAACADPACPERRTACRFCSKRPVMRVRVVCGLLETMATFWPTSLLVSVLLPMFGRPMTETTAVLVIFMKISPKELNFYLLHRCASFSLLLSAEGLSPPIQRFSAVWRRRQEGTGHQWFPFPS